MQVIYNLRETPDQELTEPILIMVNFERENIIDFVWLTEFLIKIVNG